MGGILDTVYSDLTGPEEVVSAGGAKYIMNIIDDHSSMTLVYLLMRNSALLTTTKHAYQVSDNLVKNQAHYDCFSSE